jgi:hypothetical protein
MLFKREKKNLRDSKRLVYRVALIRVERNVMPSWNVVGAGLEVDMEILRVFLAPFDQWIVNLKGLKLENIYLSPSCLIGSELFWFLFYFEFSWKYGKTFLIRNLRLCESYTMTFLYISKHD